MIAKLIDKINAEQIEKAQKHAPIRVGDVVRCSCESRRATRNAARRSTEP